MKKLVFLFLLFAFHFMIAQPRVTMKNLVFEGAGMRGIAYCGAIQEMESRNLMNHIEKTGGTSSGAIIALAVSLGYSGKEIEKLIGQTNFKKFNDGGFFFIGGINRVNKFFGWYKGKKLEKWLEKMIEEKTGNANMTFEELHQKGFKDLYITGTCLNKQRAFIFSYKTYPSMKVKDAVRISSSIPVYFEPVLIDSSGAVYNHPKQKKGFDVMVDGGFIENFPIHIFDSSKADMSTIGFRIDPDAQIKNDRTDQILAEMPVGNLKQYALAFYTIIIENLNRQQLTKDDWKRTVSVSDGNVAPKLRKLSKKEIELLINNGRRAMKNYLN